MAGSPMRFLIRWRQTIALSHLIFEGHVRSLSEAESDRRSWRGFSAVLRRSFRSRLSGQPRRLQPRDQAEETANGISQADLFQLTGLHPGGDLPCRGAGRRGLACAGQRLSVFLAARAGRSYFRLHVAQRRRESRYPRPYRGKAVQYRDVALPNSRRTRLINPHRISRHLNQSANVRLYIGRLSLFTTCVARRIRSGFASCRIHHVLLNLADATLLRDAVNAAPFHAR